MLKVGLVGVGGISPAHIPAWDKMEDAELVAICDIRPEQMEKYPEKRHYTSYEEMLNNEELDIVDICLPTYLHADYAIMAMERGINVLCEKPISINKADVKRIYDTAEKNNVKFMVAQVLRFWPDYEYVKEILDSGKYGKFLAGNMTRVGPCPLYTWNQWMMDESLSGLVPFDLHIHDLDFIVYAFGKPAKTTSYRSKRPEQDYIRAVYEFEDGSFISAESSWYAPDYPFTAEFRFQFEKAILSMENGSFKVYEVGGNVIDVFKDNTDDTVLGLSKSDGYTTEINYFADCVRNNKQPVKVKPDELENVIEILRSL